MTKKLLCNTEYKQKVSEFLLPYDGSALKKCTRFTEGVAEIRQSWLDKVISEILKPLKMVLCSSREIVSLKKKFSTCRLFGTDCDQDRIT